MALFNTLNIYTVHRKAGQSVTEVEPLFLREGFNLWAFLFTFFWTLYHRLWLASALIFSVNAVITYLQKQLWLSEPSAFVVLLGVQIIIGFHANDWRRNKLKKRGYVTAGIVSGDNQMRAEQRFYEQYVHLAPHTAAIGVPHS